MFLSVRWPINTRCIPTISTTCLQQAGWKKKLFEGAKDLFRSTPVNQKQKTAEQKRIEKLESKLRDRDEAIAMLLKESIEIKKSIDGEI